MINARFTWILIRMILWFTNLKNVNADVSPSTISIRNLEVDLNCDLFMNATELTFLLNVQTEESILDKSVGTRILSNNTIFNILFIDSTPLDFNITTAFNTITINAGFIFRFIGTSNNTQENHGLITLTNSTYLSNDWTNATQYWTSGNNGNISMGVKFEYLKQCQNSNITNFFCEEITSSSPTPNPLNGSSTTPVSTTSNTSASNSLSTMAIILLIIIFSFF